MAEEKTTYNICMGSGCHEICLLTTVTENGRIIRTERTYAKDTGQPITGICQKGIEYAKYPYFDHPKRLHYPLKRVGARGEGKFERISWEQALDEIAAKLLAIKEQYGSQAVLVNNFASSYPDAFFAMQFGLTYRFVHSFGATIMPWYAVDIGAAWSSVLSFGSIFRYWAFSPQRLSQAKYILLWGSNALGWNRAAYTTNAYMNARENGCKLVDVGIYFDSSAAMSDEFVPIKAGTDIYLAYAMINVLFRDGLYDADFLTKFTNAPFLVRKDTGELLRAKDVIPGASADDYVVLGQVPRQPYPVSSGGSIPENVKIDLFADTIIEGIPCATVLEQFRSMVAPWTPEAQAAITGVPAEVAEEIIHEYVATENSLLYMYEGLRYYGAGPTCRAIIAIPAIAGKIGKGIGGLAITGQAGDHPVMLNELPFYFAGDPSETEARFPMSMAEALEDGFPYKALINVMGNPVQAWPNLHMWENILPKLDLIVSHEVRLSDTALWSDYILPDTCTLERSELTLKNGYAVLCEPAIAPQNEAKTPLYFWQELSKRLGMGEVFNMNEEEFMDLRLKTEDPAIASLSPPLTIERLKKEKMVKLNVPDEPYDVWGKLEFSTPTGRLELYTEGLAKVDQGLPKPLSAVIQGPRRDKYPFHLFVGRHRFYVQSQFSEFEDLRRLAGDNPFARLNPADAQKLGIRQGELVEVFNDGGCFRCPVKFSSAIPEGMVFVYLAYAAKEWDGDPPQALMTSSGMPQDMDLVMKATAEYFKPMVAYPETLDIDHHLAGGWETIFDNVCDIRKAEGGK